MVDVKIKRFIFLCIISFCWLPAGCRESERGSADATGFYQDKGASDYQRLPLCDPYELVFINNELVLVGIDRDVYLKFVDKIAVCESRLVVGTSKKVTLIGPPYYGNSGVYSDLYLLDCEKGKFRHFEKLDDLLGVAPEFRTNSLQSALDSLESFQRTGKIPWIK
jgi:hypothetical protein